LLLQYLQNSQAECNKTTLELRD